MGATCAVPHISSEATEVLTSLPSIFLFMQSMRKHMRCLVSATLFQPYCWTLRVILETLDFLNESKNKLFEGKKKILDSWHRRHYLFLSFVFLLLFIPEHSRIWTVKGTEGLKSLKTHPWARVQRLLDTRGCWLKS